MKYLVLTLLLTTYQAHAKSSKVLYSTSGPTMTLDQALSAKGQIFKCTPVEQAMTFKAKRARK